MRELSDRNTGMHPPHMSDAVGKIRFTLTAVIDRNFMPCSDELPDDPGPDESSTADYQHCRFLCSDVQVTLMSPLETNSSACLPKSRPEVNRHAVKRPGRRTDFRFTTPILAHFIGADRPAQRAAADVLQCARAVRSPSPEHLPQPTSPDQPPSCDRFRLGKSMVYDIRLRYQWSS